MSMLHAWTIKVHRRLYSSSTRDCALVALYAANEVGTAVDALPFVPSDKGAPSVLAPPTSTDRQSMPTGSGAAGINWLSSSFCLASYISWVISCFS